MTGSNQDEKPLVSIIINCYNGGEYLREALDSVYGQSYQNWEIVFWDNCSTDDSAQIAKSYDERVKYYFAEVNTSLGKARNLAVSKVTGKYIAFIDCDDIWLCSKLEKQVELLEKNSDFVLCYGSIEEMSLDKSHLRNVVTLYESGYIFDKLLLQYDVNILTSMINRKLFEESGINFDTNITASEEYCLFMQLASIYKIGVLKDVLAQYRVHSNSLTSKSLQKLGDERRYTLKKIISDNSSLEKRYPKEFLEAFARAKYYDARWHMSNKQHLKAIRDLFPSAFLDKRYFFLTILACFPRFFWNKVHLKFQNRT